MVFEVNNIHTDQYTLISKCADGWMDGCEMDGWMRDFEKNISNITRNKYAGRITAEEHAVHIRKFNEIPFTETLGTGLKSRERITWNNALLKTSIFHNQSWTFIYMPASNTQESSQSILTVKQNV